ncbi:MAG: hemerythrin domain-containing protein [Pseudomonadota bacterium]
MGWNDGPLQSWYDVHEAIKTDLTALRLEADSLSAETLFPFTKHLQFFMDVLQVHSLHEDGVAFPFMTAHGINVPEQVRHEHHSEQASLYDMRTQLARLHALPETVVFAAELERLQTQLADFERHLIAHISLEDEHLIPQFESTLDVPQQQLMIIRLTGETPTWIAPSLMVWMFSNISVEHGVELLKAWQSFLPATTLQSKVSAVRAGVTPSLWAQYVDALPSLAAVGLPD